MAKIDISRDAMRTLMRQGGMCAQPDKVNPMTEHVRITTKGNRIKVESSNMTAGVRAYSDAERVTEDVSFCVMAKELSNCLASIPEQLLTLEADTDKHKVRITHQGGRFDLPCRDASEFPDFENPSAENVSTITLPTALLTEWMAACRTFASTDDLRPVMCGMRLEAASGIISASASDGHILFHDEAGQDTAQEMGVTIPAAALTLMAQVIGDTDDFTMKTDGKKAWVSANGMTLSIRLLEGRFPNVFSVIPKDFSCSCKVRKDTLVEALKRTSLMTSATTGLCRFDFAGDTLRITAEDLDFDRCSEETVACEGDIDMHIGFSCKYMTKALGAISGENVVFRLNAPEKAAVLAEDDDNSGKTVLIMPMTLN